ncbi:MAG: hypothetical protein GC149_20520 [Gammaproteobacteria bacterium]|nr:hypothetical protein [Gammaproteobacteria bacterium]
MSDHAVIQGSFAEFKTVKTRSVAQIIIEVPIEASNHTLAALGGIPMPGKEQPVAVARMNADSVKRENKESEPQPAQGFASQTDSGPAGQNDRSGIPSPHKPKHDWDDLAYPQRAGIRCGASKYRMFLFAEYPAESKDAFAETQDHAEAAAIVLRKICGVSSRSAIKAGTEAAKAFDHIESQYQLWLKFENREDAA